MLVIAHARQGRYDAVTDVLLASMNACLGHSHSGAYIWARHSAHLPLGNSHAETLARREQDVRIDTPFVWARPPRRMNCTQCQDIAAKIWHLIAAQTCAAAVRQHLTARQPCSRPRNGDTMDFCLEVMSPYGM